ncbi:MULTISPECIES: alpha/beta fold hydrolase [Nocardiaceae]|jgi:pimeloyl-ACP methyl ester carboxylesterase|uniref:alpha/beta fold hydrolase n=1 Tax=Nocardiaceae TaxID=85025 RepID=UPI00068AD49F|nr:MULTISPECIES: alpha/beta fold hydrolase [Rhodococcus]OZF03733.1 alpha/beta hydrolase [Rhodococcus sp. 15-1189-1-1a]OZF17537.1 alpha/beta hydrolase [Rhodococcus sp. 14-2686-1-2]OZF55028.1 alpha/beta hydrolase [Rhodococcus sp. 14-2470-1b]
MPDRTSPYELESVEFHRDTLRYVDAGDGPPVVLVHGLLGSHESWAGQIERLSEKYRVIAPDLFGHGDSDKPPGDYSLSAHSATIRDLLDHLDIRSAPMVGHSLGGGIVMQTVYLFPERVERIALVSSGGLGREVSLFLKAATLPGSELVLPVLASDWVRKNTENVVTQLGKWGLPVRPGKSTTETWRAFKTVADHGSRSAFLASTRAVVGPRGQTVSAKQHFEKFESLPSLLVWGGKDRMIPASHADNIRREVPNSRVEIFSDAGHFPQLDEPDLFFRVLDQFLGAAAVSELAPIPQSTRPASSD